VRGDVGSSGCCCCCIPRPVGRFPRLVRKPRRTPVHCGANVLQIGRCGVGRLIECGPSVARCSCEVVACPVKISGGAMCGPTLVVATGKDQADDEAQ
jgi:hypothetical protein